MDPWKESLSCYEDFSDELIVVGENWDYEFNWVKIGNVFQEGFNKCSGDWVIRLYNKKFARYSDHATWDKVDIPTKSKLKKLSEKVKQF